MITETDTQTGGLRTALSLLDALAAIPDPRVARGVRHGVLAVLLVSACAVLAGARSFVAIAEYAHDTGQIVLLCPEHERKAHVGILPVVVLHG